MESNFKHFLRKQEQIIAQARLHYIVFSPSIGYFAFSLFFPFFKMWLMIVAGALFGQALLRFLTTYYVITEQRLMAKSGWLWHNFRELSWDCIETVYLQQNIWGRLFNYGQIILVGIGGTRHNFNYIAAPFVFYQELQNQLTNNKKKKDV